MTTQIERNARRLLARLFMLGVLLFAAGCDGLFGPDEANFSFAAVRVPFEEGMTDFAEVFPDFRSLQIDGRIVLPHTCHTVKALNDRNNSQTSITIEAESVNSNCPAGLQPMNYTLLLFGVSRGSQRVTVYHRVGSAAPTLITQVDVTVL